MPPMPLSIFRRHRKDCPHRHKGRRWTRCQCPIWTDGHRERRGPRIRRRLQTTDWDRAHRELVGLEQGGASHLTVDEALDKFQAHIADLADGTRRKYRNVLGHLRDFCRERRVVMLGGLTVELLDGYCGWRHCDPRPAKKGAEPEPIRKLGRLTLSKEIEFIRTFCQFCCDREWMRHNPARKIRIRGARPAAEVVPFTAAQVQALLDACEGFGRRPYERLRARAMVLLLRHTGLRISDVVTMTPDRITPDGRVLLYTRKTGGRVYVPVPVEVLDALDAVPPSLNWAPLQECPGSLKTVDLVKTSGSNAAISAPGYFWSGRGSRKAAIGGAQRTLARLFKRAGVQGHPHCFRHSLATDLLGVGASMQEVADWLGISVRIAERHYAKWAPARQSRIDALAERLHGGTRLVVVGGKRA